MRIKKALRCVRGADDDAGGASGVPRVCDTGESGGAIADYSYRQLYQREYIDKRVLYSLVVLTMPVHP